MTAWAWIKKLIGTGIVITSIFFAGVLYQQVQDNKDNYIILKNSTVSKQVYDTTIKTIDSKLDISSAKEDKILSKIDTISTNIANNNLNYLREINDLRTEVALLDRKVNRMEQEE